ncbi:MAG: hypothetical protein MUC96_22865 [Myxococcaceae bacterium]|jgi:hypothetical protein|nr:hypothetical protein [Myxococcaceae bacterium]
MLRLRPVLFILCAVAMVARAEKPRLVVVPFATGEGATDAATTKFGGLLTTELKSRTDAVEVVAPPVTRPAPEKAGGKRTPSPEATLSMQTGRKAFDELRFDEAIPALKKGVEAMLQDAATADFEQVQDALVKVAAAHFRSGEEKEAKASLTELARLAPGYALPPGFPPVFQREFEKAQKRVDKLPRGQVVIEGPSGATAFLDGRDLGMVPATEDNVPGGLHYVRVEGTRGERFGQQIEIKGGPVKVKAAFGAAPDRAPVNMVPNPNVTATVDEGMAQRLTAYCKAAGADFVLVGLVYRVSDTQLAAGTALFNTRRSAFAAIAPATFDVDVLTANTEAFKLADEVLKRTANLGTPSAPPFTLVTKKAQAVASVTRPTDRPVDANGEDLAVVAPDRKTKVVVEPRPRVLEQPANLVDPEEPAQGPVVKTEAKPGPPVWVWVVVGAVAVGGAAAGTYFGVREATRPVTGTVNASW